MKVTGNGNVYGYENPSGMDKNPPEWMQRDVDKSLFEQFKKYAVEAENLRDFCERYHLPGKIQDKEEDYKSHKEELLRYGYTLIPRGTSTLADIAVYFGEI